MVRITRSKEGEVSIDPTGKMPGRGAYVSLEPEEVQQAWDKKILDRVLETTLTDEFIKNFLTMSLTKKHVKSYLENEYS